MLLKTLLLLNLAERTGPVSPYSPALRGYGLAALAIIGLLTLVLTDCKRAQGPAEGGTGKTSGPVGGKGVGEENGPGSGRGEGAGAEKTPAEQEPEGNAEKPPTTRPLIEYRRTGGFGGFNDQLFIEKSGKGTVTRRSGSREIQLETSRLEQLIAALEKAGFAGLKGEYPARGADLFTYRIIYGGHTVTAMDSAVPDALEPVLRMLNEIVDGSGVGPR